RAERVPRTVIRVGDRPAVFADQVLELELGIEVCFDGAVIIEVIAAQVGEHARVEAQAVHAPLVQRMRRCLHCECADAAVDERTQRGGQLNRARGRQCFRTTHDLAALEYGTERPERRTRPPRGKHVTHEPGGRGLAVRTGDADQDQLVLWIAVDEARCESCGPTAVAHDDARRGIARVRTLRDDRDRAGALCERDELVTVAPGAAPRAEHVARLHAPAVIGDAANRQVDRRLPAIEESGVVEAIDDRPQRDLARRAHRPSGRASTRTSVPWVTVVPAAGHVALTTPAPSTCTRTPAACSARTASRSGEPTTSGTSTSTALAAGWPADDSLSASTNGPRDSSARATSCCDVAGGIDGVSGRGAGSAAIVRRSNGAWCAASAASSALRVIGAAVAPP